MNTELQKALGESKPTLLELFNPSKDCCKATVPVVAELRERLGDRANIIALDGRENEDLMTEYKVASYPCWILFKDGAVAWRDYGNKSVAELEHMVRDFI